VNTFPDTTLISSTVTNGELYQFDNVIPSNDVIDLVKLVRCVSSLGSNGYVTSPY
jgi:hypothetical protein